MEIIPFAIATVILAFAILASIAHEDRLRGMVDTWAARSGLHIVSCEKPWLRTGPYWVKSKSQRIYRVVVIDRHRRERCAWLRCSDTFWSGERIEVEWEN